MKTIYVWNNDSASVEILTTESLVADAVPEEAHNKYCFDANGDTFLVRYGMYTGDASDDGEMDWMYIPFKAFPKEFKAYVLLVDTK